MNPALLEATKELGRLLLFGVVGWLIVYFTQLPESETVGITLVVLRVLDKYLHEQSKDNESRVTGLSPF